MTGGRARMLGRQGSEWEDRQDGMAGPVGWCAGWFEDSFWIYGVNDIQVLE